MAIVVTVMQSNIELALKILREKTSKEGIFSKLSDAIYHKRKQEKAKIAIEKRKRRKAQKRAKVGAVDNKN